MSNDKDYQALIHKGRWARLRRTVLGEHPICQDCADAGRLAIATEVHHIVPVETAITRQQKAALMYDRSNLRALCHSCHLKRHEAMGKGGKDGARRRAAEQLEEFRRKFFADGQEGGRFF